MAPRKTKYKCHTDLFKKIIEIFDVFTYPDDCHIGEYWAWGSTFCGARWQRGPEFRKQASTELVSDDVINATYTVQDYVDGKVAMDDEITRGSREITVPVICDIALDRKIRRDAVNTLNSGGYIDNLPREAAIEIPAVFDKDGPHPEMVGPIPEPFAAMMRTQITINQMIVKAYQEKSRKILLQALLLDPFVNDIVKAEQMMNEMLELQKDFISSF
jgi:alpha-galactosidase